MPQTLLCSFLKSFQLKADLVKAGIPVRTTGFFTKQAPEEVNNSWCGRCCFSLACQSRHNTKNLQSVVPVLSISKDDDLQVRLLSFLCYHFTTHACSGAAIESTIAESRGAGWIRPFKFSRCNYSFRLLLRLTTCHRSKPPLLNLLRFPIDFAIFWRLSDRE